MNWIAPQDAEARSRQTGYGYAGFTALPGMKVVENTGG